jgi:diguanylate cyclase (GGDEF)-like protein
MRKTTEAEPTPWLPSTWIMLGLTAAAISLIAVTGGRSSEFAPLLFLPVLLAVVRFPARALALIVPALAAVYLVIPSGRDSGPVYNIHDVVRLLTLVAMATFGALYAQQVQHERGRWHEAVKERDALLNVSQVVNSCDKLEYALNSALLMLRSLIPDVRRAAIYLTGQGSHLVREAELGQGEMPERMEEQDMPSGWSLTSAEPLALVTDSLAQGGVATIRAYVCLRSLNLPTGLLYAEFESTRPLSTVHQRLLRGFAERVGFPIHKVRMQEGLHSLAFTDPMTGLQNYRAFRNCLAEEWKRAARYGRPLSLIIIDLDGFKQINDRYGHPAGDQLLREVATILGDCLRETDVPARYGGEEFAVVCPETTEHDARVVAERIRLAVEKARFWLGLDESSAITCSLGTATYPTNASSEEALIDAADSALYCAKRNGKNTVRSADALPFLATESGS